MTDTNAQPCGQAGSQPQVSWIIKATLLHGFDVGRTVLVTDTKKRRWKIQHQLRDAEGDARPCSPNR